MLSMHADDEFVQRALQAGAAGYLLKNAGLQELELAVRAVARGEAWISPAVSTKLIASYGGARKWESFSGPVPPRQREKLPVIAGGVSRPGKGARPQLGVPAVGKRPGP